MYIYEFQMFLLGASSREMVLKITSRSYSTCSCQSTRHTWTSTFITELPFVIRNVLQAVSYRTVLMFRLHCWQWSPVNSHSLIFHHDHICVFPSVMGIKTLFFKWIAWGNENLSATLQVEIISGQVMLADWYCYQSSIDRLALMRLNS